MKYSKFLCVSRDDITFTIEFDYLKKRDSLYVIYKDNKRVGSVGTSHKLVFSNKFMDDLFFTFSNK